MAQYYSSLFQSGLACKTAPPAPPPLAPVPVPGPSSRSSRHQPSPSTATTATAATSTSTDGSMRFVLSDNGSLRAPTKPAASTQRGHASFLSMDANDKRSMIMSAVSSHSDLPPLALPSHHSLSQHHSQAPPSPPSPALSTHSTQSHLMRSPPSPVPSTRSLKPSTSIRRANVHSEIPNEASTMRKLSNASSLYRRTNRSRALAALEGHPEQKAPTAPRLGTVPESRSFVPFDDSDDEDGDPDEKTKFRRFVEKTRAAAMREKEERERARRHAEEQEQLARSRTPRGVSAAVMPSTPVHHHLPSPPPSAPPFAYSQNFIDLDDDSSSSSTRTRSTLSQSLAGFSISSLQSKRSKPTAAPAAGPSRVARTPVPAPPRPGWQTSAMHIASPA